MNKTSSSASLIISLLAISISLACHGEGNHKYKVRVITDQLERPWSLQVMPNTDLLVTERGGKLFRIEHGSGRKEYISGLPEVFYAGQGGLFDVILHPEHDSNKLVYFSYAGGDYSSNATYLAKAQLKNNSLIGVENLFIGTVRQGTANHYGGKLIFLPDNTLLLTVGDGFDYRIDAQNPSSLLGKTVRLRDDGSIPVDNPKSKEGTNSPVWTLGHRNPQGLAYDPTRKIIYLHEHGPRGGDEINILKKGANYGWPITTFGIDYNGARISPYTERPGIEPPLHYWTPSIAPSGLAVYQGEAFPDWTGHLLVGALVDREIRRINPATGDEFYLLRELGQRVRDIRIGGKGQIYVLTDEGQLLEILPKDSG